MIRVLRSYGITDPEVMGAMARVPRHLFIPEECRHLADPYGDHPCPIGKGQTISQPFIVAYMVSMLGVRPATRVLEIGTGCGYQTAVLLEMGARVFSIEVHESLSSRAVEVLRSLGYSGYRVRVGDGYEGWPEQEPFPRIVVSCAPESVPERLLEQLADPGIMVLPVGRLFGQKIVRVEKSDGEVRVSSGIPVRFVPMVPGKKVDRRP